MMTRLLAVGGLRFGVVAVVLGIIMMLCAVPAGAYREEPIGEQLQFEIECFEAPDSRALKAGDSFSGARLKTAIEGRNSTLFSARTLVASTVIGAKGPGMLGGAPRVEVRVDSIQSSGGTWVTLKDKRFIFKGGGKWWAKFPGAILLFGWFVKGSAIPNPPKKIDGQLPYIVTYPELATQKIRVAE